MSWEVLKPEGRYEVSISASPLSNPPIPPARTMTIIVTSPQEPKPSAMLAGLPAASRSSSSGVTLFESSRLLRNTIGLK